MPNPITPPPELVQQWMNEICDDPDGDPHFVSSDDRALATRAAQWGADQELEACRMEIIDGAGVFYIDETSDRVRLAEDIWTDRRPKPPSLKEQALALIDDCTDPEGDYLDDNALSIIRRALEALDD